MLEVTGKPTPAGEHDETNGTRLGGQRSCRYDPPRAALLRIRAGTTLSRYGCASTAGVLVFSQKAQM